MLEILDSKDKDDIANGMLVYICKELEKHIDQLNTKIENATKGIKNNADLKNNLSNMLKEKEKTFDKNVYETFSNKLNELEANKNTEISTGFNKKLNELSQQIKDEFNKIQTKIKSIKVNVNATIRVNEYESNIEKEYILNQLSVIILNVSGKSNNSQSLTTNCINGICTLIEAVKTNLPKRKARLSTSIKEKKVFGVIIALFSFFMIGYFVYQICVSIVEDFITYAIVAPLFGIVYIFSRL